MNSVTQYSLYLRTLNQLASIVELQGVQSQPQLHLISAIEITQDLKQLNSNSSKTLKSFYKDSVATPIILKGPQILRKDSSVSKKSKKPSEYMLLDEQIKENSYVKDEKQIEQLDSGLQNQQALKLSPEKEISENATQAIKKALSLQKLLQVQPTIEIAHQKPQYGIVYREDELDESQRTMNQSSFSSNFTQNIPKPDGNESKSEQDHEKSLSLKSPLLKSNNMGSQHALSLRSKMSSNRSLQRDLSGLAKSAEHQANPVLDQLAIQQLTASQYSNQDQNSSIQILQAIQDSQTTDHQVTHHEQMLHNFRKFEKRIKRLEGLSVSSISSDPQFIEQIVSLKETLNIIQKSTSSLDLEDTNQLQKYQERRMEKLFDFEERLRRLECGFNGTGDEQPLAIGIYFLNEMVLKYRFLRIWQILEEDYETHDHQHKDSDADELESSLNSKELALIEMVNKDAELKKKDSTDEVKSHTHEQSNGIQQSKQQLSGADNTFQRESSQNLQKLEASKHVKNSLIQKTNSSQFKSEDLSEDDLMRGDSSVKLEGSIVYGRKNHPKRTVFDKISLEMKNEEQELQAQTSLAEQIQTLKSEDKKVQQQNIQDDPATIEQISKNQQTLLETNAQNEMSGEPNSQNLRKSEYKLVKTQSGRQIRIRKETPPSLQLVNIRQVEIVNPSKQQYFILSQCNKFSIYSFKNTLWIQRISVLVAVTRLRVRSRQVGVSGRIQPLYLMAGQRLMT